jgi:hypothetical protein
VKRIRTACDPTTGPGMRGPNRAYRRMRSSRNAAGSLVTGYNPSSITRHVQDSLTASAQVWGEPWGSVQTAAWASASASK